MHIKKTKAITYRKWSYQHGGIPCLIIQGLFLKGLGFNLHDQVHIEYYKNKIIITKPCSIENLLLAQGEHPNGK